MSANLQIESDISLQFAERYCFYFSGTLRQRRSEAGLTLKSPERFILFFYAAGKVTSQLVSSFGLTCKGDFWESHEVRCPKQWWEVYSVLVR